LRTFLALCVVIEHSGGVIFGVKPMPGFLAVQSFYIVSGFYMALVLTEKYRSIEQLRLFYHARAHRLYPIYWTVLSATIALDLLLYGLGVPNRLDNWFTHTSGPFVMLLAAASNVALFGLDWFRLSMGNIHENTGGLIIVVQSWTLGVELCFYAIVPLLIRLRSIWLLLLLLASFIARAVLYSGGPVAHVWTNAFFPFELGLFVAGMLAYRTYVAIDAYAPWKDLVKRAGWPVLAMLMAAGTLCFEANAPVETGWGPVRNWIFLASIAVALPVLFLRFRHERYDDSIGRFSYPVYMVHFLFVTLFAALIPKSMANISYFVLPLTLIGAWFLIRRFETPQPSLRTKPKSKAALRPLLVVADDNLKRCAQLFEKDGRFTIVQPGTGFAGSGGDINTAYAKFRAKFHGAHEKPGLANAEGLRTRGDSPQRDVTPADVSLSVAAKE